MEANQMICYFLSFFTYYNNSYLKKTFGFLVLPLINPHNIYC